MTPTAMRIKINNKETQTNAATIAQLAEEQHLPEKGVAVAVNNEMVARADWSSRIVREGDDIVILKAFCGG